MTGPELDRPTPDGAESHQLTVAITAIGEDGAGPWRVVATCTCLGFGRTAVCTSRPVAEYGRLIASDYHGEHVGRCRRGLELPQGRPGWLDPLP